MLPPPIPGNEEQRLKALRKLLVLDTPRQQRLDKIVDYAAQSFSVPIASISLVHEQKVCCVSVIGLPRNTSAPRSISFCSHAILDDDFFVIEDAKEDERFHNCPLVEEYPFIRFYAAATLSLPSGLNLGTLCILDHKPRRFDAHEYQLLSWLRDIVVTELLHPDTGKDLKNYETGLGNDILVFIDELHNNGIFASIKYLNSLTPHRYTGFYKFEGHTLRNVYMVDKFDGTVEKGSDETIDNTYCSYLLSNPELQLEETSASEHYIPSSNVIAYCGTLIQDAEGNSLGSLCHFDTMRCEVRKSNIPLLRLAGPLLYKAYSSAKP